MPPSAEPLEGGAALDALEAAVVSSVAAAKGGGRTPVILIDGPSGAGKSSLADRLLARWPAEGVPRLVRMDDLYPGWDGLDAGSTALGRNLLEPLRATGRGAWERWDWERHRAAELHTVTGGEPLVVEGCGTLSRENASLADLTVWLHADDALRKRRALARDGETFAVEWDRWQAQFERFVEREHPVQLARLVLDVTAAGLAEPRPGTTVEA
ncbi:ATP-binding protein [Leifsonia poae]|uniref:ATP-binding protein n=1 Tax=Leifsonia poae TaxID=110933 RepID=UPI003D6977FA